MAAKTPVVNYTPEMTLRMVEDYSINPTKDTVAALAVAFGKSTKSIIAKLSREGVYKKAEYVAKSGEKPVKKDAMVETIAALIGVASEKLDGLEKAPKVALGLIHNALKAAKGGTPSEA